MIENMEAQFIDNTIHKMKKLVFDYLSERDDTDSSFLSFKDIKDIEREDSRYYLTVKFYFGSAIAYVICKCNKQTLGIRLEYWNMSENKEYYGIRY